MTLRFENLLDGITRVRGVQGAMLVSADDGLVVAESSMETVRGSAVAALAASLVKRLTSAAEATGVGTPQFVHLQSDDGALLVVPAPESMVLVVVAEAEVNVGLARLEMLQAVQRVL